MRHWNISFTEEEEECRQGNGSNFCSSLPKHVSKMTDASDEEEGMESSRYGGPGFTSDAEFQPVLRVRKENQSESLKNMEVKDISAMKRVYPLHQVPHSSSLHTLLALPEKKWALGDVSAASSCPPRHSIATTPCSLPSSPASYFSSLPHSEWRQPELWRSETSTEFSSVSEKYSSPYFSPFPLSLELSSASLPLRTGREVEREETLTSLEVSEEQREQNGTDAVSSVLQFHPHSQEEGWEAPPWSVACGELLTSSTAMASPITRDTGSRCTPYSIDGPSLSSPVSSFSLEGPPKEWFRMDRMSNTRETSTVSITEAAERAEDQLALLPPSYATTSPLLPGTTSDGRGTIPSGGVVCVPLEGSPSKHKRNWMTTYSTVPTGSGVGVERKAEGTCTPPLFLPLHIRQSSLAEEEEERKKEESTEVETPAMEVNTALPLSSPYSTFPPSLSSSQRFSRHLPLREEEGVATTSMRRRRMVDGDGLSFSPTFSNSSSLLSFSSSGAPHSPCSLVHGSRPLNEDEEERQLSHSISGTSTVWIGDDVTYSASLYRDRLAENLLLACRNPNPQNTSTAPSSRVAPLPPRAYTEKCPPRSEPGSPALPTGREGRLQERGDRSRSRDPQKESHGSSRTRSTSCHGMERGRTAHGKRVIAKPSYPSPTPQSEAQAQRRLLQSSHHDPRSRGEDGELERSPSLCHRRPLCPIYPSSSSPTTTPIPTISPTLLREDDLWSRKPPRSPQGRTRNERRRAVSRTTHPHRVLEAPSFPPNASQLLDWGSNDRLAIGLHHLLYLWNPVSGESTKIFKQDPGDSIVRLTWVQHSAYIALAARSGVTRVADGSTGKTLRTLRCGDPLDSSTRSGDPKEPRWSCTAVPPPRPTGREGPGSSRGSRLQDHDTPPHSSTFAITGLAVRGPLLAVATNASEGLVRVFDLRVKEALAQTFHGFHHGPVASLCYAPMEPYYLATGSADGSVLVWDGRRSLSPRCICPHVHAGEVTVLQWNPRRSRRLISGGRDGVLCHLHTMYRNVDVEEEEEVPHTYHADDAHTMSTSATPPFITRAHQTGYPISGAIWHPDRDEIVTSHDGEKGHLQLRHSKTFQLLKRFSSAAGKSGLSCLTFSPNKVDVCAAQGDETLKLWEVFTDETFETTPSPPPRCKPSSAQS